MSPPLMRRSAGLLLATCALLLCAALLPLTSSAAPIPTAAKTKPVTSVKLTYTNSSTLSFTVGLPANTDATELHVFVQPVRDGNATDAFFPLTLPGPMVVEVTHLPPDSEYVFTFYLESPNNGTSAPVTNDPAIVRTHRLGPAIVGFFARDQTATASADPSVDDAEFSTGDQLIVAFNIDTNQPPVGDKAAIDSVLAFSLPIGAAYSGQWLSPTQLLITIVDVGQSSPPLGELNVRVVGDIRSPDGKSDVSRSVSPPLIGSYAPYTEDNPRYFVPLDAAGNALDANDIFAYGLTSLVDEEVPLRLALDFPPGSRSSGYGLNAMVTFPTGLDMTNFGLSGKNFTFTGPVIGTSTVMTNEQLKAALRTLVLTPMPGYLGYVSVRVDLTDKRYSSAALVSSVYMTVKIEGPPSPVIPVLTVGGSEGSMFSNPIKTIKTYQTPLIIGLSVVAGVIILAALSIFGYKKYRSSRDSADFESHSLTGDKAPAALGGEGGPTRRFYYDAKV